MDKYNFKRICIWTSGLDLFFLIFLQNKEYRYIYTPPPTSIHACIHKNIHVKSKTEMDKNGKIFFLKKNYLESIYLFIKNKMDQGASINNFWFENHLHDTQEIQKIKLPWKPSTVHSFRKTEMECTVLQPPGVILLIRILRCK